MQSLLHYPIISLLDVAVIKANDVVPTMSTKKH